MFDLPIVRRCRCAMVLAAGMLVLGACGDQVIAEPEPVTRNEPGRIWKFFAWPSDGGDLQAVEPFHARSGGTVSDDFDYGALSFPIRGDARATGEVFSSPTGETYWVSAEAPGGRGGNRVELIQTQSFVKEAPNATLDFIITKINLLALDAAFNPVITDPACNDPNADGCSVGRRGVGLSAQVSMVIEMFSDTAFYGVTGANLTLDGQRGDDGNNWIMNADVDALKFSSDFPLLWSERDFAMSISSPEGGEGTNAEVQLKAPITFSPELSHLKVGEEFTMRVTVFAETYDMKGGPDRATYVSAFLRDPISTGGTVIRMTGLRPTNRPVEPPPRGALGVAPLCTTPNSAAGTLQFSADAYRLPERGVGGRHVTVTRTGGSSGRVSATVRTQDGTASSNRDYTATETTVSFRDGDTGPRTVRIPFTLDAEAEPDRSFTVTMSEPRGCATLGAATALVVIADDDRPAPPSGFTVGGRVTGVTGSGLVLESIAGERIAVAASGVFAFVRLTATGQPYGVRVATQPTNPSQVCTVRNASGTMGNGRVTDVAVECVAPPPIGGLDGGFGTGGRVVTPLSGGHGEAVVVQLDGKIIVASKGSGTTSPATGDFTVLRYLPSGTPDAGFGTNGVAQINFPAGRTDEAFDVALQSDGRIVVVGSTQTANGELDFGVARFNADGTVDRSFGANGVATVDFGPGSAVAQGVVIQPDGRIVAAGHAQVGPPNNDFALARFNADGTPDASFGTAGRVTTPLTGRADLGMAVALAPGGMLVVAGRVEQSGLRRDDFAVARYTSGGVLDPSFGAGAGFVTTDFGGGNEQANDVVVLAGGSIVAAGYSSIAGTGGFDYAVARYTVEGRPDASFNGLTGTVKTDLSGNDDFAEGLVVLADGKVVVVGRKTGVGGTDLALIRYLPSGALDPSFGNAGRVEVDVFGTADEGQAIAVQPDGRIVAVGATRNGSAPQVLVVRVVP